MNILSLQILQARITTAKKMRTLINDYKLDGVYYSERKALEEIIVAERKPIVTETIPQLFSNAKKQAKNDEN